MLTGLICRAGLVGDRVAAKRACYKISARNVAVDQSSPSNAEKNPLVKAKKQSQLAPQTEPSQEIQEYRPSRPSFYPDQMEWLDERQVRISRPSKNVMQSGTAALNTWKIEFNSQKRWENWLMGWTSSADPVSNLTLNFPTKEDAIAFCSKNRLQWFVDEQPERKIRRKSYADNFSWNKRTRLGNK